MPEKKERLKVYQLSLRHPSLAQFRNRPFSVWDSARLDIALSILILVACIPALVYEVLPRSSTGIVFGVLCASVAIATWPISRFIGILNRRSMLAQMNEDSESARKPSGQASYVGMAYTGVAAYFDEIDSAWDRGWLLIDDGCLRYEGINSQFSLPIPMIAAVRTAFTNAGGPRVIVSWQHPDGTEERFNIEIRDAVSRKDCIRRAALFEERLSDAKMLSSAKAVSDAGKLPFRSTIAEQTRFLTHKVLAGSDYAVLVSFVVVASALTSAVGMWISAAVGHNSSLTSLQSMMCILWFAAARVLIKLLQARRYREYADKCGS